MTAPLDLYGLLGVERTATKQEIHQAFRAKAKVYHPDVPETGDEAKFAQMRLARDILSNPSWRANYDAVGAIDEEAANNEIAHQITTLTGVFGTSMHALLSKGMEPHSGDFVKIMREAVKSGFDGVNTTLARLEKSRNALVPMAGRFKVRNLDLPNLMETIVAGQLEQIDQQIGQQRAQMRNLEIARLYLDDVWFQHGATL